MKETLSLAEVGSQYPIILLDTSVLLNADLKKDLLRKVNGEPYTSLITEGVFRECYRGPLKLINRSVRGLKKKDFMEERILKLKEHEELIHRGLVEGYSYFQKYFGVGNVDIDEITSAGTISSTRENTAIISNDNGMCKSWGAFLNLEGISQENFGFFYRVSSNRFSAGEL